VFAGVNPKWHAAYSRALLEGDPSLVRIYIQLALASINDRLRAAEIPESELERAAQRNPVFESDSGYGASEAECRRIRSGEAGLGTL
jgi:hypothetical protein